MVKEGDLVYLAEFVLILLCINLVCLLENNNYNLGGIKDGLTPLINLSSSNAARGLYFVSSTRSIQKNNQRSFLLPNTGKMYYSSSSEKDDDNFFDWLGGITDAEGSFGIGRSETSNRVYFNFTFVIALHVDDIGVLEFIQKRLGVGKVYTFGKKASFIVKNKKHVKVILDIFTKYPLKTHKYLNFLDFKKAFQLYTEVSTAINNSELLKEIEIIKSGMNTLRSEFNTNFREGYPVTSYWLLGFVEGEGSFFISKGDNYRLIFSIGQSLRDLPIMEEIKKFFNNLAVDEVPCNAVKYKNVVHLHISQKDFIINKLIPLFDSMTWRSKKGLDYQDWKFILRLKELGLQYTKDGLEVIDQIINQMNDNRLSTSDSPKVDRAPLISKIESLLNGPSNLEEREGRLFIKSLNRFRSEKKSIAIVLQDEKGNILNSFGSIADCIKFSGLGRNLVYKRYQQGKPILLGENLVYIKKVEKKKNSE